MGATMMPIMSAALATLGEHTIARGSTFLNISQQVAASMGTALFSVLLTNGFKSSEAIKLAGAVGELKDEPGRLAALLEKPGLTSADLPDLTARALVDMADAFSHVFVVATVRVACCLVPACVLPRRRADEPVDPTVMTGH